MSAGAQRRHNSLKQAMFLPGHEIRFNTKCGGIYVAIYTLPEDGRQKLKHAVYEGREQTTETDK